MVFHIRLVAFYMILMEFDMISTVFYVILMNFLCELRFIHFSRVGLPASTPTFRRREDSFAHHVGVQARRDNSRERRLLPAAEKRNEKGGHPLLDRQCACEDQLVARGRFRVLCGARHRHGARHERVGPEVPDIFC